MRRSKKMCILALAFLVTVGAAVIPVHADLGNCHSYVYWRLSGLEVLYVSYAELKAVLDQQPYKPLVMWPQEARKVKIKEGDVLIFGPQGAHSGVALNDGCISHMRGTSHQQILRDDGTLHPQRSGFSDIPTKWLIEGNYRDDISRNGMVDRWRSQGASMRSIRQKFKQGRNGFYGECNDVSEVYQRLSSLDDNKQTVALWRLPSQVALDPPEASIFEDDSLLYTVMLYYDHTDEWVDAAPFVAQFVPEFVEFGAVLGSDAGVGTHEINAYVDRLQLPAYVKLPQLEAVATLTVKQRKAHDVTFDPRAINLSGEWHSRSNSRYVVTLSGGDFSYSYEGTDKNYKHAGTITWKRDAKEYSGDMKDQPGFCCGNNGKLWLRVIDRDTVEVSSEWYRAGESVPFMKAKWEVLELRNSKSGKGQN